MFASTYDAFAAVGDASKAAAVVFVATWRQSYDNRQIERGNKAQKRQAKAEGKAAPKRRGVTVDGEAAAA